MKLMFTMNPHKHGNIKIGYPHTSLTIDVITNYS